MKKYLHLLEKLGMTIEERTVYVTLLEHPYLTITEIARYTSYHRPSIYRAIASLESEGYVEKSFLEGKRYFYHATSPQKLREKLDDLLHVAERIIPEMDELHKRNYHAPVLSIAEGIEGIRNIHDDVVQSLPAGGEYLCYSSSSDGEEKGGAYISDLYERRQRNKELSRKVITNSREKNTRDGYRDIAMVPASFDQFDDDITKLIYGNKVAVINYHSQIGWVIEDARFARYEEKIFRLLFRLLSKSK